MIFVVKVNVDGSIVVFLMVVVWMNLYMVVFLLMCLELMWYVDSSILLFLWFLLVYVRRYFYVCFVMV